jgi:hypothetical protein
MQFILRLWRKCCGANDCPLSIDAFTLQKIIICFDGGLYLCFKPSFLQMKNEQIIRAVAGSMVLLGVLLSYFVHPNWIWLCAFVGANLLQSSFTKWCPLETMLNMKNQKEKTGISA